MTLRITSPLRMARVASALAASALAVILFPAAAPAAEADTGRNLAAACAGCHGTNGNSVYSMVGLAGMPKATLVRKMQEFNTGAAPATVMQQISKGYTERQIDLIAAFFAAQKPAIRPHADNAAGRQQ